MTDDAAATEASPRGVHTVRSRALIGVLCALLGFALVVQLRQTEEDDLSSLRQDDLVALLDEVTRRGDDLARERAELLAERNELLSGEDSRRVAEEAARQRAIVQGILAGTLPVRGAGISVTVVDPVGAVRALTLFNMLQELRNAGAEAIEVSGRRLTASSWFADGGGGVLVDGVLLEPPYVWLAIGDPQTLAVALEIPGGALAAIRSDGGNAVLEERPEVTITAVREVGEPRFATPTPAPSPGP